MSFGNHDTRLIHDVNETQVQGEREGVVTAEVHLCPWRRRAMGLEVAVPKFQPHGLQIL